VQYVMRTDAKVDAMLDVKPNVVVEELILPPIIVKAVVGIRIMHMVEVVAVMLHLQMRHNYLIALILIQMLG
jgi:hypothetical protein